MNKVLHSDIETCGFYPVVNSSEDIFSIASKDHDTGVIYLFHDHPEVDQVEVYDPEKNITITIPKRSGSIQDAIKFWKEKVEDGYKLSIHNCIGFDKPIVDKIFPDNDIPFDAYHDTYIQSKVQWFERPTPKGARGAHGLEAYGIRCGFGKPKVENFSEFSPWIVYRLLGDIEIQHRCYEMLQEERNTLYNKYDMDFTNALKIESLYTKHLFEQELTGALIDVDHVHKCIKDLDEKIEALCEEIEPQLPPSLEVKSTRITRKEMVELFGYDSSNIEVEYIPKKKDGEIISAPKKDYYAPTINYTRVIKTNYYQGYHIEHGMSPQFEKKTEFTKWRNENYPDTKPKSWIVDKVVHETEVLNSHTIKFFDCEETDIHLIGGPFTKINFKPSKMTQTDVVKRFLIKLGWNDAEDWNIKKDVMGAWVKAEEDTVVYWPENANPGEQLSRFVPKKGLMVTTPKLGEDDYNQLPEGLGQSIAQYNTYQHRRRFLENPNDPEEKGLLSYIREDGRVPCGVNNFNTRSGRSSHRVWVNAPGDGALYGEEIRRCIIAPEGRSIVGVDMKSAQLSIAAYFANNEEYYNNVATGQEEDEDGNYVGQSAHCVNARMFGMVSHSEFERAVKTQSKDLIHSITLRRKKSKGGSFATLFGASGKKVAKTIGIPEKEGHARKEQFLKQMGLDITIKTLGFFELSHTYKGGFFLPLAFGYWLWNNSSHKSVNTIVQGFEALAQKMAAIKVDMVLEEKGLLSKADKILDMHDEMLFEVDKGYEKEVGVIVGECYTWAAEQIFNYHKEHTDEFPNVSPPKFPIDLNGGYKTGSNYYECH